MCGIAGSFGGDAQSATVSMTRALAHRGPDGEGFWKAETIPLHFGHRRLAIVDLTDGQQPMTSANPDLAVTFNGEIYNHRELRSELEAKGHRFQTSHSDTEVLLHGYTEWGPGLVDRLNGMWAFALYDSRTRSLLLSRDRFGQKPLYYASGPDWFAFASELTALARHPSVDTSICPRGLLKYFAYGYIPAPHSALTGCHKLPAGCQAFISLPDTGTRIQRYWHYRLEPDESLINVPETSIQEELREHLGRAVSRRLVADVPIGCFLSGGIDSSSISALAAGQSSGDNIRTFSIAFREKSFDESAFASLMARHLGSEHTSETLSLNESRELLPEIINRLDEPLGDPSLLPTYLLSKVARKKVTVALGGDGADEFFSGYDPFRALLPARLYARIIPAPLHQYILQLTSRLPVSHRNMSLDFKLKRTLRGLTYPPELWAPTWMAPLDPGQMKDLLHTAPPVEEIFSEAIAAWNQGFASDGWHGGLSQFFVNLYLQDDILPKVDRAAMMHGLEPRSPFLDIDLVNFIRKLPRALRYRRGTSKWLLRQSMGPMLPGAILRRPKKGFGIPVGQWVQDEHFQPKTKQLVPHLNPEIIDQAKQNHLAGRSDERSLLWNVWVLQHWLENMQHDRP